MNVLITFLANILGGLANQLAAHFTQRTALILSTLALTTAMIGALYALIESIVSSIEYNVPNALAVAMTWVMPGNFTTCVTAYFATRLACAVYKWKYNIYVTAATGVRA